MSDHEKEDKHPDDSIGPFGHAGNQIPGDDQGHRDEEYDDPFGRIVREATGDNQDEELDPLAEIVMKGPSPTEEPRSSETAEQEPLERRAKNKQLVDGLLSIYPKGCSEGLNTFNLSPEYTVITVHEGFLASTRDFYRTNPLGPDTKTLEERIKKLKTKIHSDWSAHLVLSPEGLTAVYNRDKRSSFKLNEDHVLKIAQSVGPITRVDKIGISIGGDERLEAIHYPHGVFDTTLPEEIFDCIGSVLDYHQKYFEWFEEHNKGEARKISVNDALNRLARK